MGAGDVVSVDSNVYLVHNDASDRVASLSSERMSVIAAAVLTQSRTTSVHQSLHDREAPHDSDTSQAEVDVTVCLDSDAKTWSQTLGQLHKSLAPRKHPNAKHPPPKLRTLSNYSQIHDSAIPYHNRAFSST